MKNKKVNKIQMRLSKKIQQQHHTQCDNYNNLHLKSIKMLSEFYEDDSEEFPPVKGINSAKGNKSNYISINLPTNRKFTRNTFDYEINTNITSMKSMTSNSNINPKIFTNYSVFSTNTVGFTPRVNKRSLNKKFLNFTSLKLKKPYYEIIYIGKKFLTRMNKQFRMKFLTKYTLLTLM